jgi:hypothetical protein
MNTKTSIVGMGFLAFAGICCADSLSPWNTYRMGTQSRFIKTGNEVPGHELKPSISKALKEKAAEEAFWGLSLQGTIGSCNSRVAYQGHRYNIPNVYGGRVVLHYNIPAKRFSGFHDLSFNVGFLTGDKCYEQDHAKLTQEIVPVTFGYVYHKFITDKINVYAGGKVGAQFTHHKLDLKFMGMNRTLSENNDGVTACILAGFQFSLSEHTSLTLGYELAKFWADIETYSFFSLGLNFAF